MQQNYEYYPLTNPQKGIWYTEKLYPDTSIGIIAGTLKIRDTINYSVLENAIHEYIYINDSLRLHFVEIEGEPKQYYSKYSRPQIKTYDFSQQNIRDLYEWDSQRTHTPFPLIDHDLYEIAILKISDNEAGVYIKMHHMICDGWSIVNAGNDIFEIYSQLLSGNNEPSKTPPSYIEFINREIEYEASGKFIKDQDFWKTKFESYPEFTTLKVRTNNLRTSVARRKSFVLPARLSSKIFYFCHEKRTSIFTLYLSALSIYLNRIFGKDDITIGVPVLNRSNAAEKNTFGMFISTVPVRIAIENNLDFIDFSDSVYKEWMAVLKHHKYSYNHILKDVRERFSGINDLYDITLSYQNAKIAKNGESNHEGRWHFCGHQRQSLNIHVNDRENDGTIIVDYDYLTDVFYAKEIEFLHDHIIRLLWHALDNPQKEISRLDMVSEKEKNRILYEFNKTDTVYPSEKSIIQLFEEQVLKTPDAIAVINKNVTLSYKQLNKISNELAWRMLDEGVRPNDIVVILIERNINALVSILATLKCGATFLNVNPAYPTERIKYIINDSKPSLILNESYNNKANDIYDGLWMNVDNNKIHFIKSCNPNVHAGSQSIAYIIYTSGSTGTPKGAIITQKGLVNYIMWANKVYIRGEKVSFPLYSSLSFDLTITSIFTPLISGNSIVLYEESGKELPILSVLRDNKVDIVKLTPAHLNLVKDFDNTESRIRRFIVGGEELKTELTKQVYKSFKHNVEIFNEYGPTETVVGCMIYKYDYERDNKTSVPIGVPADNVQIYILDKFLNPVPIGFPGELYIGGDGVCKGYLNRPDLTAEKFIKNPYRDDGFIYKSGDLARWYPQGDVEYLGRIDYQVKINGFRIELGEIENQIMTYDNINEAVAIDREDSSGKRYICAYIVSEHPAPVADLRTYLLKKLPSYMMPSYFVYLDKIPLTPNGKVDRNRLPEPGLFTRQDHFIPPSNEEEEILSKVVSEILDIENISVVDKFSDMGIDSLTIVRIQARLFKYDWETTTQDFYEYPCIRLLADKIRTVHNEHPEYDDEFTNIKEFQTLRISDRSYNVPENILLTGATGFLGIHLLSEILDNSNANVYCLVRGQDESKAVSNLLSSIYFYFGQKYKNLINNRIMIVHGDFAHDQFGLNGTEYINLGNKITTIIHSGAVVKHYGNIELFEKTNIFGTEEIIKFALKFDIRLNHISTVSIAGNCSALKERKNEFFEKDIYIGQSFDDNIYIKSKYKAEELIVRCINENKLKANIFRLGNITGKYTDGSFQKNRFENMFYNKICSIINLGVIPENLLDVKIELSPVDFCSTAIMSIIKEYRNVLDIYHILNNNSISIMQLVNILNQLNNDIKSVRPEAFSILVKKFYDSNMQSSYLYSFVNDLNNSYHSNISVNSDKTLNALSRIGFSWPLCDKKYLQKLYGDLKKNNLNKAEDF